jgi:hypothetical protein
MSNASTHTAPTFSARRSSDSALARGDPWHECKQRDRFVVNKPAQWSALGGEGADVIDFGELRAGVNLNPGRSRMTLGSGNVAMVRNVEHAVGTSHPPCSEANRKANRLLGRAGNDLLVGRAGNDWLVRTQGEDIMFGGPGSQQPSLRERNRRCQRKNRLTTLLPSAAGVITKCAAASLQALC